METIIINSSHRDTSQTNRFTYRFPQMVKFNKGDTVALQSISMYNSIFNVEASRSNNTMQVIWNADTIVTYTFTIPDGNYTISQLNYFLQQQCVLNKLYVTNSTGDFIYFIELLTNSTRYACQINSYALPTSAQASSLGYTKPSGATWNWPTTASNAQFVIPSSGFGSLLGFTPQTIPSSPTTSTVEALSSVTPQIAVVNSIILTCNLIQSKYAIPINVFYSIPINVGFGSMIDITNTSPISNNITQGLYSYIQIDFLDQAFQKLVLHDFEIVLTLNIKSADSQ